VGHGAAGDYRVTVTKPHPIIGVGSPQVLYLDLFGDILNDAFGATAYLVGSAARGKVWRDVDVRVILDDNEYHRLYGQVSPVRKGPRWTAMAMAFSALGREMTGLPIDFQLQSMTHANGMYGGEVRVPLFSRFDEAKST
jgi:hypothetical protein